jgi:hypothetical protein
MRVGADGATIEMDCATNDAASAASFAARLRSAALFQHVMIMPASRAAVGRDATDRAHAAECFHIRLVVAPDAAN